MTGDEWEVFCQQALGEGSLTPEDATWVRSLIVGNTGKKLVGELVRLADSCRRAATTKNLMVEAERGEAVDLMGQSKGVDKVLALLYELMESENVEEVMDGLARGG